MGERPLGRIDQVMSGEDGTVGGGLNLDDQADAALLALVARVAFSDNDLDDAELAFLSRLVPRRDPAQLAHWVRAVSAKDLDYAAVRAALPSPEDRWKALRFAARMAWKDGAFDGGELRYLSHLAVQLELGESAADRVLEDVQVAPSGELAPEAVAAALGDTAWSVIEVMASNPESGELVACAPDGAELIHALSLDGEAIIVLFTTGMSACFAEGTSFVRWSDIAAYSRVSTFRASVEIFLEDGSTRTLVDSRLRALTFLLDRWFVKANEAPSQAPVIVRLRGG